MDGQRAFECGVRGGAGHKRPHVNLLEWALAKEARGEKRTWPRRRSQSGEPRKPPRETTGRIPSTSFVQVHAVPRDGRFEVRLRGGRRVYIASDFDADGLRRLLSVLEGS